MKDQRALVTGGAGVVGSHIVDRLVEAGAARWSSSTSCPRAAREPAARTDQRSGHFVEGDIRDAGLVADVMRRHRRRVPPGGDPDHPMCGGTTAGTGGDGRRDLQHPRGGRRPRGVGKVVAASSAAVYGAAETFPTPETHHTYAQHDTLYGAAKAFNEGLLRSFHDMYGLDYVALRYFNVYGPRMDIHGQHTEVLVRWMDRIADGEPPLILGDGAQTMDFVYVEDVARRQHARRRLRRDRRGLQRRHGGRGEPDRARRHRCSA